jgi:sulfoxide reductase heme-binding subunit YedZ
VGLEALVGYARVAAFARGNRSDRIYPVAPAGRAIRLVLCEPAFWVVGWSAAELLAAFSEKTYIILGMLAWLLMVPLGVTSNRWSQRRLGKDWRRLHRAIYLLAILACLHFIWLVRSDYWQPALYAFALFALLIWRSPFGYRLRNKQKL